MPTNFPTSLDIFTNPTATDPRNSATVPHDRQHADANDAIEALEAKLGIDGSADPSSIDYRLANLSSPDFAAENKDGSTVSAGMAVAIHGSGTGFVRADADAIATRAVGLLTATTLNAVAGTVRTGDVLTLADWTAATGAPTLAAKADYFLSDTLGLLTTTAPSGIGQIVQRIGYSLSPDSLMIEIDSPILL